MEPGRKALVTGTASGIGRAIAQRLVEEGHSVLSVDLEPNAESSGTPYAALDVRIMSVEKPPS